MWEILFVTFSFPPGSVPFSTPSHNPEILKITRFDVGALLFVRLLLVPHVFHHLPGLQAHTATSRHPKGVSLSALAFWISAFPAKFILRFRGESLWLRADGAPIRKAGSTIVRV